MAKFTVRQSSLGQKEIEKLLIIFCQALAEIKKPTEAADFIQDLLSEQESLMLAKRLAVAKELIKGEAYLDIQKSLKVSAGTVARVNIWLRESGQGYRTILERIDKSAVKDITEAMPWKVRRRRATVYNWPMEMIEEIFLTSNKKQRQKILSSLNRLRSKSKIYKEINQVLYNMNK